jgi:hypothetical protein
MSDIGDPVEEFTIGGEAYLVSELRMGSIHQLQAFLRRLPRPPVPRQDFSGVTEQFVPPPEAMEGLAPEAKARLLAQAQRMAADLISGQLREARSDGALWPPQVGTPQAMHALNTAEGGSRELLWVVLRQHRPETTRKEAGDLLDKLSLTQFLEIQAMAFGGAEALAAARGALNGEIEEGEGEGEVEVEVSNLDSSARPTSDGGPPTSGGSTASSPGPTPGLSTTSTA